MGCSGSGTRRLRVGAKAFLAGKTFPERIVNFVCDFPKLRKEIVNLKESLIKNRETDVNFNIECPRVKECVMNSPSKFTKSLEIIANFNSQFLKIKEDNVNFPK